MEADEFHSSVTISPNIATGALLCYRNVPNIFVWNCYCSLNHSNLAASFTNESINSKLPAKPNPHQNIKNQIIPKLIVFVFVLRKHINYALFEYFRRNGLPHFNV